MTAENRLPDYLRQMIEASSDAVAFTEGMSEAQFMADLRTQRAVVMCLMIVGEAATRIVSERSGFVEAHGEIPWRSIRGMRNRIAHGYFDIDLQVVWRTVQAELPTLIEKLRKIPS